MDKLFEIILLDEALDFLSGLEKNITKKFFTTSVSHKSKPTLNSSKN